MSYRLYWIDRERPDVRGDARCVTSRIIAQAICEEHNRLYPKYRHAFLEVDPIEALLEISDVAAQ